MHVPVSIRSLWFSGFRMFVVVLHIWFSLLLCTVHESDLKVSVRFVLHLTFMCLSKLSMRYVFYWCLYKGRTVNYSSLLTFCVIWSLVDSCLMVNHSTSNFYMNFKSFILNTLPYLAVRTYWQFELEQCSSDLNSYSGEISYN